ncbi:MAG TPA: protein kinase [Sandaracinaceae bacterium]
MALNEGEILAGKYRIERLLGEGGMGAVYVALNQVLQKRVALKVMSERFASVPAAVERFLREAVAASRVSHPSIVQVFDAGDYEGKPWIAMELLEGESLGERLERGPLTVAEALKMAEGALSALSEVHEEGIIHRDLKPDNIFLARTRGGDWIPKVLDFGVAKDTSDGQLSKLTATGAVVGTAHYLSPEQAKGLSDIDARADIYAMGVVLFESLSGRMPFEAETITQLIAKMFTERPRRLQEVAPHVPEALAEVVNTCLEADRERRFQTARALLGALRAAAAEIEGIGSAPTALALSAVSAASGARAHARVPSEPGAAPQDHGSRGGHASYAGHASPPSLASYAGHASPAPHALAAGTPMPASHPALAQTTVLPPGAHVGPPPPKSRKGPLVALVLALFLLGAAGTALGAWVVLAPNDEGSTVARATTSTPGVQPSPPEPATTDPPVANVPASADVPAGVDPDVESGTDSTAASATEASASRAGHERSDDEGEDRSDAREPRAPGRGRRPSRRAERDEPDERPGVGAPAEHGESGERPAAPPPDPPRPPALRNGLSQAQVMTAVQSRMPEIQRNCYLRRRAQVPGLAGVVTVAWTVRGDGRADDVRVVHNGTGDEWLARCVESVIARTRFPPGANGLSTPARYPFQFR